MRAWKQRGWPIVYIRHDSTTPGSAFTPGTPGNALDDGLLQAAEPDVLVTKSVSSAFHGEPNLDDWLRQRGIDTVVVSGIQTNMCCETTARVAGNLGYRMLFALDATRTFDLDAYGGGTISADDLTRATAANLDDEFGEVVTTEQLAARARDGAAL